MFLFDNKYIYFTECHVTCHKNTIFSSGDQSNVYINISETAKHFGHPIIYTNDPFFKDEPIYMNFKTAKLDRLVKISNKYRFRLIKVVNNKII